ncbi:MAG: fructose-bisphosphatase class III [Planctomycetota bacterium]
MSEPGKDLATAETSLYRLLPLARQLPTIDAAVSRIARLSAELTLPKETIHILSDVHGEYGKLRHVINNASGKLRQVVEPILASRSSPDELRDFLALLFYPQETLARAETTLTSHDAQMAFCQRRFRDLFEVIRRLVRPFSLDRVSELFPKEYRGLLRELCYEPSNRWSKEYVDQVVKSLLAVGRAFHLMHLTVRVLRNLAIDELILAGDFWDRGPRGDLVMDYIARQPRVAITWGNHDMAWMGACLGNDALVAHVLRISTRYRRHEQLEEGYGIRLAPLEQLARTVYADDPSSCFIPKGEGGRETSLLARMQKAAAILQFKLEGTMIARNPQWNLDHRRLLHRIDPVAGTIEIDGVTRTLRDKHFPTIDGKNPYALSPEEEACLKEMRQHFMNSQKLWEHIRFLVQRGSMYLVRDDHVIFHGCLPVDEEGDFLPLIVDGEPYRGRMLMDALDRVVVRAMDRPSEPDKDLLWYLWCGPRSPLFGKDRIATLENDLVVEKETHAETKDPYFRLIHEVPFCDKILEEFGADPARGLIVNGHVPVKIDQGESPIKRSGKCITIDGAFSAAYGDHGYTLLMEPGGTYLAKLHHFESIEAVVQEGVDIIPTVSVVKEWNPPRRVGDTERGAAIRAEIAMLEDLVAAYRTNKIRQEP